MGSPSRNVQYHPPRLSEDRLNLPQPHSPSLPYTLLREIGNAPEAERCGDPSAAWKRRQIQVSRRRIRPDQAEDGADGEQADPAVPDDLPVAEPLLDVRSGRELAGVHHESVGVENLDCFGLAGGKALLMANHEPVELAEIVTVGVAEDVLLRQLFGFDSAAGCGDWTRVARPERITAPVCDLAAVARVAAFAQINAEVDALRRVPRRKPGRDVLGIASEHQADPGADERQRSGDLRGGAATPTGVRIRFDRSREPLGGRKDAAILTHCRHWRCRQQQPQPHCHNSPHAVIL